MVKQRRAALLLVDLQNDFSMRSSEHRDADRFLFSFSSLIRAARRAGHEVIWVHTEPNEPGKQSNHLLSQLPEALEAFVSRADLVISKRRLSAFQGTELLEHLCGGEIEQLYLLRGLSNMSARATITDACYQGFDVCVIDDDLAKIPPEIYMDAARAMPLHDLQLTSFAAVMHDWSRPLASEQPLFGVAS